ncbi:MAG: HIT family protein [Candidatus Nanoarchaeia archaeon]|nr:HIT family protein [Candidatus Nanoarchaeia archaeon]
MCEICKRVKIKKHCFYEDDLVVACVSKEQVTLGKSSVYYKKHVESFFDLSEKERNDLMKSVLTAAKILKDKLNPDHFNYLLLGNYYSHLHWHIIPRYFDNSKDNFYFKGGLEPCHLGREIMGRYSVSEEKLRKLAVLLK